MSAPGITYSGVLAKKEPSHSADVDGGIFRGLKFWVSARVPHRKTCVDTIRDNGGSVVPTERNASILICDPSKELVSGSYSYQLVADALKEGSLDIKEDYLCDSPVMQPSQLKPTSKIKLTRTKFTDEDDRILTGFVTEMERLGKNVAGNDIYKKFAEEHPHHTWHSWRDRWIKKLKIISHLPAADGEQPAPPNHSSVASRVRDDADRSPAPRPRTRFTPEEDDIILETIHHAIKNDEPWNGYEPYKRLASEFPQRTYNSWRDRALNHVAGRNKDQIAQWELETHLNEEGDHLVDNVKDQQSQTIEEKVSPTAPVIDQGVESEPMEGISRSPEKGATHRRTIDDSNNQEHQAAVLPPMPKARSSAGSPSAKQPVTGSLANRSSVPPTFPVPQPQPSESPITTQEQFYRDYNTYLEIVDATDRRTPTVRGKTIALWDLWQSVRSKKVEVGELDWQQIAEDLGFDWVSNESVPEELHRCYEEHLAPFADAMMSFNDSSDEEGSIEDNADTETERPLPSSPPALPSLKRPRAALSPIYQHVLQSSPKRRRLDRDREIPSTPEHPKGTPHLRSRNHNQMPASSPLGNSSVAESTPRPGTRLRAKNWEDGEIRDKVASLSAQSLGQKRRLEPETQDFTFDRDTQVNTHNESPSNSDSDSQKATKSSRQLLLEDAASTTPTPHRRVRVPFQLDDSDDEHVSRNDRSTGSVRVPLPTQRVQQKRQLPRTWASKSPTRTEPTTSPGGQPSSATVPETEPQQRPARLKETPEDIIDHFGSLGYTRDIVLRSLRATSWIIGNAGQVMEMLKQGEPLPPRTTGVWTPRDDDSLALVFSKAPSGAKEEKKRAKEMRRLQAKHGVEQIDLRRRYLLDQLLE
ncbi:hypothetical protein NUW58_g1878 [Xylaria curta]|uniref:Uncharacterized protein n=1 Tax=Xylaria curta TaxID=42375 RepID=A0ACC1PJW8_9PEZI|nr:hypothetical protein NUW58_g1878 [Xylaria curta]